MNLDKLSEMIVSSFSCVHVPVSFVVAVGYISTFNYYFMYVHKDALSV